MRRSGRVRGRLGSLVAAALVVLPLVAQDGADPFRDSDFDGHWTGTLRVGGVETPIAVNLAVGDTVLASVMLPDGDDPDQSFDPFPTEVTKARARRIDLVVDTGREGNKADEVTLILKYKKASDSLRVKAKGNLKGRGDLLRSDTERPLRGVWGGDLLLALDETGEDGARLAVTEVSGFSWSDDPDLQGPVEGTRNGDNVQFTVETRGGDLEFTGQLRDADTELRGELSLGAGNPGNVTMTRASGGGQLQIRSWQPDTVTVGATTAVTLDGRNFAVGLLVDTDVEGVAVTAVTIESATRARLSVSVASEVAAGRSVGLRIRNADGQVATISRALATAGGGNPPSPGVSFAGDVLPILDASCHDNACHTAANPTGSLILTSGVAYANLVNVPSSEQPDVLRVAPGDAEASYLVRKLRGDPGISGVRMPRARPPLSDEQIRTIMDWIDQGAANNRLPR